VRVAVSPPTCWCTSEGAWANDASAGAANPDIGLALDILAIGWPDAFDTTPC